MNTLIWGPLAWRLLHTVAYMLPPNSDVRMQPLMQTLPKILPCKYCRMSFADFSMGYDYDMHQTTGTLPHVMYALHNCVNHKLAAQQLGAEAAALIHQRVTLDVATKREVMQTQVLSNMDVLDLLCMIALNIEETRVDPALFLKAADQIGELLAACNVLPDLAAALTSATPTTPVAFVKHVYSGSMPVDEWVATQALAKATCKADLKTCR